MELDEYQNIENEFESANAFQCKHCGELVVCDGEIMAEHLDECEYYDSGE